MAIGMHPNTANNFKLSLASSMFDFLLDILPLDTDTGEEEEEKEKSGGSEEDTKMQLIYTQIPKDKSND